MVIGKRSALERARELQAEVVGWRRFFHENPEPASREFGTARKVAEVLEGLSVETRMMAGGCGVRGFLPGGRRGKTIALRADIDALPMPEETNLPFRSRNPGVFHGCGHDAHAAMLLGAARILSSWRSELPGNVIFIFQPAEETGEGAGKMVAEGVLEKADAVFGVHVSAAFPSGTLHCKPGPLMAAGDFFDVKISGKGGHGGMPQAAVDPIAIASQAIAAVQTILSREVDPLESAVVSVCRIQAGSAYNIIPDFATFGGTLRAHTSELREYLPRRVEEIVRGVAASLRGDCEFTLHRRFPPTANDERMTSFVAAIAREILGAEKVFPMKPLMGSEDFAFYLEKVPGAFVFLGGKNESKGIVYPQHHPKFDLDEDTLPFGTAMHAAVAAEYLMIS
jgi:amidohydrolase